LTSVESPITFARIFIGSAIASSVAFAAASAARA
jgi:hypothetical protein